MEIVSAPRRACVIMHKNVSRGTIEVIAVVGQCIEMRTEKVKYEIANAIYESGVLGRYITEEKCLEVSNMIIHNQNEKICIYHDEFWLVEAPFIE